MLREETLENSKGKFLLQNMHEKEESPYIVRAQIRLIKREENNTLENES